MCRIAGRLRTPVVRQGGAIGEIPALERRLSNLDPLTGPGTASEGQFDWGGFLPKRNGGVQRLAHRGRQSRDERKGISQPYCETDRSNSCESRA